jgi:cyanophycinase
MRKILLLVLAAIILVSPASYGNEMQKIRGTLVIVGGGLQPDNREIFTAFIEGAKRCRGRAVGEIRVGIIPAGSATPLQCALEFRKSLVCYGVPQAHSEIVPLAIIDDRMSPETDESRWKENASKAEVARQIDSCDALWFVGGDQMRYKEVLFDKEGRMTAALSAIWKAYRRGAALGGTSAGAAVMSDPMISGGDSIGALLHGASFRTGASPAEEKGVGLMKGLGFFPGGLVDQHFTQRGRLGRLIVAAAEARQKLAFGIDEDTALVFDAPTQTIRASGRGSITIVDMGGAHLTSSACGMTAKGLIISLIESGDALSLSTGEFNPAQRGYLKSNEGPEIKTLSSNIFESQIDALTTCLQSSATRETMGLIYRLENEERARGFMIRFWKEDDTRIIFGTRCGRNSGAALKAHMDITPVEMEIRKKQE